MGERSEGPRGGEAPATTLASCGISGQCPHMVTKTLSPKQAATRAGCGRTSIVRALSAGQLRAVRDNEGNWQIEPEALDDWLSMRRSPDRQSPVMTIGQVAVTPADTPETLARLAAAEARSEALSAQVEDLRTERDRLLTMLENRSETRTPVGFFTRLFGR